MPFQHNTQDSYTAYLTSWGYYYSGEPIGSYRDATVLATIRRPKGAGRRRFVFPEQMIWASKEVKTVCLAEIEKEGVAVATTQDDVEEPACTTPDRTIEFPAPSPLAPASPCKKRKRAATPDDEASSENEAEIETTPKPAKKRVAGKQTDSDEEIARRLHLEMNARPSRFK